MEPDPAEPPSATVEAANGAEQTRVDKGPEGRSPLSAEELTAIEDEGVLDKMVCLLALVGWGLAEGQDGQAPSMQQLLYLQLDQTTNFEERKLIRAALRELRQRKRGREPVALLDVAAPFLSCCPHPRVIL